VLSIRRTFATLVTHRILPTIHGVLASSAVEEAAAAEQQYQNHDNEDCSCRHA
jgi:hypothetical protein